MDNAPTALTIQDLAALVAGHLTPKVTKDLIRALDNNYANCKDDKLSLLAAEAIRQGYYSWTGEWL